MINPYPSDFISKIRSEKYIVLQKSSWEKIYLWVYDLCQDLLQIREHNLFEKSLMQWSLSLLPFWCMHSWLEKIVKNLPPWIATTDNTTYQWHILARKKCWAKRHTPMNFAWLEVSKMGRSKIVHTSSLKKVQTLVKSHRRRNFKHL